MPTSCLSGIHPTFLLAASAVTEPFRTGSPIPNAAPPLPQAARRRVTDPTSPSAGRFAHRLFL
jgi:hypothetical protein